MMKALLNAIHMPPEAVCAILSANGTLPASLDLTGLTREDTWTQARAALQSRLAPDPQGFRELAAMLRCALAARSTYEALGFSEEIYYATFACFSRFVREYRESLGTWGFDRGFWTVRQVSCRLFRIGELEYELTVREGAPAISLHIPSDARLQPDLLRSSYTEARRLLDRAFPEYAGAPMYCHSWLLSPTLRQLLPGQSRILAFQRAFSITPVPSSGSYVRWVYKDRSLAPEQYPETTTLQRSLKAFLLSGGTFQDGLGFLLDNPFPEKPPQDSAPLSGCPIYD